MLIKALDATNKRLLCHHITDTLQMSDDRHTGLHNVKSCFSKQKANRCLGMDLCDPSCSLACCFRKGKWVGVRFQQRTGTSELASPGKRWMSIDPQEKLRGGYKEVVYR